MIHHDLPTLEYHAYGAAAELFRCTDAEVLLVGPAGTGKTRAVLEKVAWCCDMWPQIRVLLCRATRKSMTESVLVTWERKVLWPGHPALAGGASRAVRDRYVWPNGSEIIVGGLDHADKIMSTEFDLACVFEATECSEEDYEKLLSRLRNNVMPYQQAVCDCNPGHPGHWLHRRAQAGRMRWLHSRHEDNPSLTADYLDRLSRLTGHRRARLYEGRWVAGEGVVYPEFDPSRHVIEPFLVPPQWPWYVGIDPGYDHPCAILWFTVGPAGTIYIADELYRGGLGIDQHAADIHSRNAGRTVIAYGADPQHAFSHTAQSPRSIAEQFAEYGLVFTPWPRSTNVEAMVNEVRRLLVDGKLKVFRTCVHTIEEFQSWSYKRTLTGELPAGDDQFEDRNNHAMDVVKGMVAMGLRPGVDRVQVIRGL